MVHTTNQTKFVSLSNRKCTTQATLVYLHPNEYKQGLDHYLFAVNLCRFVGSCNTLNDLPNKKTKDLNVSVFNMIIGIDWSKALTKYILCEFKYKFDRRKCNSV